MANNVQIIPGKTTGNATQTRYCPLHAGITNQATESLAAGIVSSSGIIRNLRVEVSAAPGIGGSGKKWDFTIYKNGNPTAATLTIFEIDITNVYNGELSIAQGDYLSLELKPTSTPAAAEITWSCEYVSTLGNTLLMSCTGGSAIATNSFLTVLGSVNGQSTEFNEEIIVPCSGIIKNLFIRTNTAVPAGQNLILTVRKNNVSQLLVVTLTAGQTTGNNISNSFIVSAGDSICIQKTGTSTFNHQLNVGLTFLPDTFGNFIVGYTNLANTINFVSAIYTPLNWSGAWNATEANVDQIFSECTLKNMYVELSAAPSANQIFTLRKNTSSQSLTVTIDTVSTKGNNINDVSIADNNKLDTLKGATTTQTVKVKISYTGFRTEVVTEQEIITSDVEFINLSEIINSNIHFKAEGLQQPITSDVEFDYLREKITSNVHFKAEKLQEIITSDVEFLNRKQETITSDVKFVNIIDQEKQISTWFGTIFGQKINTDIRTRKETDAKINTDIRFNIAPYEKVSLTPLARTDFHVKIGTSPEVELEDDDLILDSIKITHTADEKGTATFSLTRKHDDINNPIIITDNQWVHIYIKDELQFVGRIQKLDCSSSEERIDVFVEAEVPNSTYSIVTKELPLTIPNEKLHLYDVLLNDISIDNPYILSNEENPKYYKGIKVNLGTKITEQIITWFVTHSIEKTAEKIEEGTFKFVPNYTYFWTVNVELFNIWVAEPSKVFYGKYIGTSLISLSTDLYEIVGADYFYQRVLDDKEEELGEYTVGTAPYKEISVKNGKRIAGVHFEDRAAGLYQVKGISYDYEQYCKNVASIEYQKIKNINGNILPRTSANIDLTIDGYLYYRLRLLTRINLVNTTTSNIYKYANGFPVSIKQITIDSGTMKVNLGCDNNKSNWELERLTGLYPEEPVEDPETAKLVKFKFDLPNEEEIDE